MDYSLQNVKKSWKKIILKQETKSYYKNISDILESKNKIYPERQNIFETFKYFKLKESKVVLVGQDPYIRENQAMGMSFSVPKGERIPPSLRNIYIELEESVKDFKKPNHGDLSRWVKEEKIVLLNGALSVLPGKSNSHATIWKDFTDYIIKKISKKCDYVVFILLGNYAKSKAKLIDQDKHGIVTGVHPSPLSCKYNKKGESCSFFGHNIFNKVNELLIENNKEPINWNL